MKRHLLRRIVADLHLLVEVGHRHHHITVEVLVHLHRRVTVGMLAHLHRHRWVTVGMVVQ